MGSSQSQPSRPSRSSRSRTRPPLTQSSSSASSIPPEHTTSSSRFPSLRRLSDIGRRDSSKRYRGGSVAEPNENDVERKKQRVEASTPLSTSMDLPPTSPRRSQPVTLSPPIPSVCSSSQPRSPSSTSTPSLNTPISPHPQDVASPPGSPDPLLPDRLRTLSTIRDTLGPGWPNAIPNAPVVQERLQDIQRRSSITPDEESLEQSISDRLYSLLGLSPPQPTPARLSFPPPTPSDLAPLTDEERAAINNDSDTALSDLTRRLQNARANLADAQRQLEEVENASATQTDSAAQTNIAAATENSEGTETGTRGIPAGAVLVIQGLAQTQAVSDSPAQESNSTERRGRPTSTLGSIARRFPGLRNRSSSEGNVPSPDRSTTPNREESGTSPSEEDSENAPTLDGQARMISGLLTVAATATATTLLAPSGSSPSNPSARAANPISSFLDRFRSNRRTASTVEAALGNYLRSAITNRQGHEQDRGLSGTIRPDSGGNDITSNGVAGSDVPSEFMRFLEVLQEDIVGAVRQFAGPTSSEDAESAGNEPSAAAATVSTNGTGGPASSETTTETRVVEPENQTPVTSAEAQSSNSDVPTAVPSFHRQLGQIRPDDPNRRYGVTGGTDGQPRRLNLFRAHMFPPMRASSTSGGGREQTGAEDPEGMVPCLFVGVRSLAHDPTMTTDDLVQHPNFPFTDGNVPDRPTVATANNTSNNESSTSEPSILEDRSHLTPPTPLDSDSSTSNRPSPTRATTERPGTPMPPISPSSEPITDRRSIRERVLDILGGPQRQPSPERTTTPLNTYLVFVIGGYYPRSHPILSIPNLITGGPLSDEEMALISELMGPGKPPTASKEDIEKSGLEVVKAGEIPELGQSGKILQNCVERCLVCLSEYEPEEECRILKCRHAYHKECVDQWLSSGRNSCPACRTEAVDVKKGPATSEATETGEMTETTEPMQQTGSGADTEMTTTQDDPLSDRMD